MKYKTAELTGALLDEAAAKAEGLPIPTSDDIRSADYDADTRGWRIGQRFSSKWADGGPIIERERIAIVCSRPRFDTNEGAHWDAYFDARYTGPDGQVDCDGDIAEGPTPLVAAMRAFVAAKLGDEVDL